MTTPIIPSINLAGIDCMPIDVTRLLQSDSWLLAVDNPAISHALMTLWLKSWQQVPAASVPANDLLLAKYVGIPNEAWEEIKGAVMSSWTLCDDGRYYHPVVAEKALEADNVRAEAEFEAEKLWRHQSKAGKASAAKRWGKPAIEETAPAPGASVAAAVECQVDRTSVAIKEIDPRQVDLFQSAQPAASELLDADDKPVFKKASTASMAAQAEELFEYWKEKTGHSRARWAADREKIATKWLKQYPLEELKEAVDGNAGDEWHRKNERDSFELIFRDRQHIEDFQNKARKQAAQTSAPGLNIQLNAEGEATFAMAKKRREQKERQQHQNRGSNGDAGALQ